ncbi:MAG: DUF87 domain-containing protein [Candidatus Micrarchaeaceae archaeon]
MFRNAISRICFFAKFFRINRNKARIGAIVAILCIGKVHFGNIRWQWKKKNMPFAIEPESSLNPHIAIVGRSGSGKSNACKLIVKGLVSRGIKVAILDPHNEYIGIADQIAARVYNAAHNGINIFELDGVSEKEKANELTNMFKRVFKLGDVQGYHLYRAIMFTYNRTGAYGRIPNIHDLLYTFEIFRKHATLAEQRVLEGLSRRLSLLDTGPFTKVTSMDTVMGSNSIFLLSGLHTNEAQAVYVEGFLRKIYGKMLASDKKGKIGFYIVIDEAEKLGQKSIIGKIAAEGRKYGIGLLAMAQRAKAMEKEIRANASLFFAFYQREPEELNYVANLISGGNELNRFAEVKRAIRGLGRGTAIMVDSRSENPSIVRFALNVDGKTSLAYEIMRNARTCATYGEILAKATSLGFSADMVKNELDLMEAEGSISYYEVKEGSIYDGRWYIESPRNSPEHDVCVNIIKRHLESLGIRCRIYNSSYGPDLIANYRGTSIAVEYETGSKSIDSTERMLLARSRQYKITLVIVNDLKKSAYEHLNANVIGLGPFLRSKCAEFLNLP